MSVLAERRGKFNAATSSDLSRLEDTLTNAVFGALRYLPGEVGLAAFGRLVGEDLAANIAGFDWKAATVNLWSQVPSVRTASGYVEPDVVISVGDLLMGVEAKYRARFDEYPRAAPAAPLHQLTVQAEALRRSAPSTVRRVVVVALTDAAQPPYDDLLRARSELTELGLADEVAVVWAGWHQVGRMLATLPGLRSNESALRDDVVDYLTWRKVLAVYEPVDVDDWTAVGLAASAGSMRVFPAIAAFQRTLDRALAPHGIVWGNPFRGVNLYTTTSLDKESEWFQGRVSLSWWPSVWGERRAVRGFWSGLYTCFDFVAGHLEVGFAIAAPSAAEANATWSPAARTLAGELAAAAPVDLEVAVADHVLAPRRPVTDASQANTARGSAALSAALTNLGGSLLLRRLLPAQASADDAMRALIDVREVVERCPQLLALVPRPA